VKVGDFGCAVHTVNLRETKIGSMAYHSPEQLSMKSYDSKVDVWGLGIITYELIVGCTPYDSDIIKILNNEGVELSKLKFPSECSISNEAKDFINQLLKKDPNDRMSLFDALKHPFMHKYLDDMKMKL